MKNDDFCAWHSLCFIVYIDEDERKPAERGMVR